MVAADRSAIEFWFDFSSPYGYFASHRVDGVAAEAQREVRWRPFLLGAVFKETGSRPLVDVPLKGDYARRDWERLSRLYGVPWRLPARFPIATMAAARIFYWLEAAQPALAKPFAQSCYAAYFGAGRDIGDSGTLVTVGEAIGIAAGDLLAAIDDEASKQRLRAINAEALDKGVFGSPFFIVDGERFWGSDRLEMFAEWLARGGW